MAAELLKILSFYGQSTIDQIRMNLADTGTTASGKSAQSLRFEVTDNGARATLKITAKPFFMVVETGRKATPTYKPSKQFVQTIREWLQAKGGDQGAAYAIARTIHKKGTNLWQAGGRKDIVSNVVNQSLTDKIAQDILTTFARQYVTTIKNAYGNQ